MVAAGTDEDVLPLHAETLVVTKRTVETHVLAERVTTTRTENVALDLARDTVVVDRIKHGTFVDAVPPIRDDGEFIVIPVVDEVLVTERRLVLTEEIRLRRVRTARTHAEQVTLRSQHVVVTRTRRPERAGPDTAASETIASGNDATENPGPGEFGPRNEGNRIMSAETIVALFDTPAHAELAVQDLLAAGIPTGSVERHEASGDDAPHDTSMMSTPRPGFWSRLFGAEPEQHVGVYDRSLASGATVVTVRPDAGRVAEIVAILESHHPVDMDEREAEYGARSDADLARGPEAAIAADGLANSRRMDTDLSLSPVSPAASGTAPGTGRAIDGAEVLTLSAEALAVGKRVVNRGGTRVRRYVVETPAEQTVSLHGERVAVERRAVDGARAVEPGSFSERAIEMTETDEVPVVRKNARVVEEVVLRKEAVDRTETVRDTVRHEDVAIERVADGEPTTR